MNAPKLKALFISRRLFVYAGLVLTLLGIPLMVVVSRENQDRRSRADTLAVDPGAYGYGGYSEGALVGTGSATPTLVSSPSATPLPTLSAPTATPTATPTPTPTLIPTATPTPLPVTVTLTYNGKPRDLVGPSEVLNPDGKLDGSFTATLSYAKTITRLDLTGPGTHWNTNASDGYWGLGAALTPTGALVNAGNGPVNFTSNAFTVFASDTSSNSLFKSGNIMTLLVTYSDGKTSTVSVTLP